MRQHTLSIPGLFIVIIGFIFDLIPRTTHERSDETILISHNPLEKVPIEDAQDSTPNWNT